MTKGSYGNSVRPFFCRLLTAYYRKLINYFMQKIISYF